MSIDNSFLSISRTKENIIRKSLITQVKKYNINSSMLIDEIKNMPVKDILTLNSKNIKEILEEKGIDVRDFSTLGRVEKWLASDNECSDGNDDGKISFWSKVGNCIEGCGKAIVGTVYNIVTDPKKLLTTLGTAAIMAIFAATPIGAVVVPVLGVIAAYKLIKNGVEVIIEADNKAKNAKTDEEAKDAWEAIGQGGTETAIGVYLAYSGTKGIAKNTKQVLSNKTVEDGIVELAQENTTELKNSFSNEDNAIIWSLKQILDPGNIEIQADKAV